MTMRWNSFTKVLVLLVMAFSCTRGAVGAETRHFDLRVYAVTPGKMEGVLERFREAVDPIRRRHGVDGLGYWTAKTKTNETYVYLLSAPNKEAFEKGEKEFSNDPEFKEKYAANSKKHGKTLEGTRGFSLDPADAVFNFAPGSKEHPRTFEVRIYTAAAGKAEAFWNRWTKHAVPIYARHGLESLGAWKSKDKAGNDLVIVLLAGTSAEGIQKSIGEFHADPEWQKVEKETEKDGPLRTAVEAIRMTPTDFSKLQ